MTIEVVTKLEEYNCPICHAFVLHEPHDDWEWLPIEHDAPCGRQCIGGGVYGARYLIGDLHRTVCVCAAELDGFLNLS